MVTIYAPNDHQDVFIRHTLETLMEFTKGQLILGGHFNAPPLPLVDTSTEHWSVSPGSRKRIAQATHSLNWLKFGDCSIQGNGTIHFTPPRIKCIPELTFLVPHGQLHAVCDFRIGNITWSDPAPISLVNALSDASSLRPRYWRLNESLLQDPEVLADVTKELNLYFQTNDQSDCDPGILWEAHKMVLGGILIKHGSQIKQECGKQLQLLLDKLYTAESRHKHVSSLDLDIELGLLRKQIIDLLHHKAKAALQFCPKTTYELGNKCGKLLAKMVREHGLSTCIPQIITTTGRKATLSKQITQEFRDFYSSLYKLPGNAPPQATMEDYIVSTQLPSLPTRLEKNLFLLLL